MSDGRIIEGEYGIQEIQLTDEQIESLRGEEKVLVGERGLQVSRVRELQKDFEDFMELRDWLFQEGYVHDCGLGIFDGERDEAEFWSTHPDAVDVIIENMEEFGYELTSNEPSPGANTNDTGKRELVFVEEEEVEA